MDSTESVLSSEEEAHHQEAEARVQSFKYTRPELPGTANKGLVRLCGSGMTKGIIQVIQEGGENTLHYHDGMDSFWMVMKGRVRFYGPTDNLIGEYGPNEGLITPAGARYWFEKASEEELDKGHITDLSSPSFLQTNFWYMRQTTFAFQVWHSPSN